jgi:hypothetical protein
VTEEPGDGQGTKWKRLFNAVVTRQNAMRDGRPLIRPVTEVMAPVRFGSAAEFGTVRARVNEQPLLSGRSKTELPEARSSVDQEERQCLHDLGRNRQPAEPLVPTNVPTGLLVLAN